MRLRTHDVRDAEPLLIAVAGLDHAQHEYGGADAQRSPARKIERSIAFWRIVDDNHEFRRMSRLVAAALLDHRLPRPPPDRILLGRFCGVPTRRIRSPCCARTASGHAAAAPPSSVMNWRLFTRSPRRRGRAAESGPSS